MLAYQRTGDRSGTRVVLLHGIPGGAGSWDRVARALGDDADVVIPDLLGFGASPRPTALEDLHANAQARAVAALLDELGGEPAVVVGHDFGGPIALTLMAQRPDLVAGLGLLATNTFTDTPIPFPLSTILWPVVGAVTSRLLFSRPSLMLMARTGESLGDAAQVRAVRTIFEGSLRRLRELYAPVEAALSQVAVPAFVAWGERDPFFPVAQGERTAAAAGVPLRLYPGAGHFLPQERPDDVASDVAALLAIVAAR